MLMTYPQPPQHQSPPGAHGRQDVMSQLVDTILNLAEPSEICGYPLVNDHIAGWNIPVFNRKYSFIQGPFSIAMLDYRSVIEGN